MSSKLGVEQITDADGETWVRTSWETSAFGPGKPKSREMVQDLSGLYDRLAKKSLLPDDTVPLDVSISDGDPLYLTNGLKSGEMNQPDARIFKHLRAEMGVILDVGAHWGYMAMSMLNSGTTCPVISFEAVPYNQKCLQTLRDGSASYDYMIGAVSNEKADVTFYNPVVNGTPIDGVNSINGTTLGQWWVPGTIETIEKYFAHALVEGQRTKLQLGVYSIEANTLDELLTTRRFRFPVDRVAAIKIDVEGHERSVLDGARTTILRDHPLLVIEDGSNRAVKEFIDAHSYEMVQRNDDQLEPLNGHGLVANEFFIHGSMMDRYREIGLLRG
jgi:FkbM family methyltransferase